MKIHQLRNATFVIESKKRFILVDPMLSDKGELLPFSFLKFKRENNPTVKLPDNAKKVLDQVTDCIVTHSQKWGIDFLTHKDHLDAKGIKFLKERNIKVATFHEDTQYIQGFGVKTIGFEHWEKKKYLDGNITFTPNKHGYCPTDKLMPKGSSVFLELAGEPSLMILGDTVLSNEVAYAIEELRPDIVVLPCGGEELDLGSPITMNLSEILSAISLCRGHVVANHMEALNNCPITREELAEAIKNARVTQTVHIPKDGETLEFGNNIKVPKKKTIKKPEVKPTKPIEEELMEGAQNLTKSIKKTIENKEELKEVTKIAKKATKDAKKKFDDISKVIKTTIEDSPIAPMKDEKKTTKAPAKKATATKTAAKKPASKSAKAPAKKAPAKKPASKSSSAKKAPAKKPAAKK